MYNKIFALAAFFLLAAGFYSTAHAQPSFWLEPGIRISSATPSVITTLPSGTTAIFWSDSYNIHIATSSDGVHFSSITYTAVSISSTTPARDDTKITSCSIVYVSTTTSYWRMIYACQGSTVSYSLLSSTSTDMINWVKDTSWTPFTISGGNTFIDSPLILATTTQWYLFYTRSRNTGNNPNDYVIAYATSTDYCYHWKEYQMPLVNEQSKDPGVIQLANGTYRMYYVGDTTSGEDFGSIRIADSSDLRTYTAMSDPIISQSDSGDTLSNPRPVKSADGYSYRLYYGYTTEGSTNTHTLSAQTTAPHLISISPDFGHNDAPVTITLTGEIFSPSPTIVLSSRDQADITATSVVRTNDMSVSGTFDIVEKKIAGWTITITNNNGEQDSIINGFKIYDAPTPAGNVEVADNVINPLKYDVANISYTIFDEGVIKIKIYTSTGDLVKTVVDENKAAGSYMETWNGKNDSGETVASGIYLVFIEAPGIKKTRKIAVIK